MAAAAATAGRGWWSIRTSGRLEANPLSVIARVQHRLLLRLLLAFVPVVGIIFGGHPFVDIVAHHQHLVLAGTSVLVHMAIVSGRRRQRLLLLLVLMITLEAHFEVRIKSFALVDAGEGVRHLIVAAHHLLDLLAVLTIEPEVYKRIIAHRAHGEPVADEEDILPDDVRAELSVQMVEVEGKPTNGKHSHHDRQHLDRLTAGALVKAVYVELIAVLVQLPDVVFGQHFVVVVVVYVVVYIVVVVSLGRRQLMLI